MVAVKFHVDDLGYFPQIEGAKDNKVGKRDMQGTPGLRAHVRAGFETGVGRT
jgi:hypothetical protein